MGGVRRRKGRGGPKARNVIAPAGASLRAEAGVCIGKEIEPCKGEINAARIGERFACDGAERIAPLQGLARVVRPNPGLRSRSSLSLGLSLERVV